MGPADPVDRATRAGRLAAIEVEVPMTIAALAATHDRVLSVNGITHLGATNVNVRLDVTVSGRRWRVCSERLTSGWTVEGNVSRRVILSIFKLTCCRIARMP